MKLKPRKVRLFSIAYGDLYLDWLERACIRSLKWPKNYAALQERVRGWDVWTTKPYAERARAIAETLGFPVEIHDTMSGVREELGYALHGQVKLCYEGDVGMLWVAPDSIFGDGTIRSFMEIGRPRNLSVALAPMRVDCEGFLEALGDGPVSNARLVRHSFERMHPGFAAGEATREKTNTFKSGVYWRKIDEGLYAVSHRLPSPYLYQPMEGDHKWMLEHPKLAQYDHRFPSVLVDQQRQRVIGSSDAGFVAELTRRDVDAPEAELPDPFEPDKYFLGFSHNKANRNLVAIWRAE